MTPRLTPGRYLHFKGGVYLLLMLAEHHEHNGDYDVIYVPLSTVHGKPVTRPARPDSRNQKSWTDMVEWPDGRPRYRFVPEESLTIDELQELRRLWTPVGGHGG